MRILRNRKEVKKHLKIAVINGPNINLLGIREPEIYGPTSWSEIENQLLKLGKELGVDLSFFQSNHEGIITDYIQQNLKNIDGIVLNPAAFSKYGYSILDALTAVDLPFVEVHISNIFSRGEWHAETIFAARAVGVISGFQGAVYQLGIEAIHNYLLLRREHTKL